MKETSPLQNDTREYRYIDSDPLFASYRDSLAQRRVGIVALDLEAEFNLHVYGEHFCLLQIFDGHEAVLVDPRRVSMDPLRAFLEDRDLLKITYDSASDRALLFRTQNIRMRGLLDLRPAVELLEFEKRGLSAVLEATLGIAPVGGKKKYQQYNWMRRPLDPGAIVYALEDVLHLFELQKHLFALLQEKGLLERYILENLKVQDLDPQVGRRPGFLRTRRFYSLSSRKQALLEALYQVREGYAQGENVPPDRVLPNRTLLDIVDEKVRLEDLRPGRGITRGVFSSMISEMIQARDGEALPRETSSSRPVIPGQKDSAGVSP
ncbi:ribonuclease D [Alkalispirochaeta americana]|uniref:Ribonuclease D n=1 Tax=Alkalispirochaeta americana TaxID=159291 RepID=A0A1N6N6N7_9SPIO|nr:HRDC domain-containing protein [Alkalispirochaeta americana]SIP87722.1 ribonuclease D [Alkalispirochaeta americana]